MFVMMTTRDYYSEMICILRIIHRLRKYPWISAQTMDPSIAQADPWISQIHRLRPTAARPVMFRWIYDYYYNAWFFYVSYFIVLMIGTTNTTTCGKERNYLLYQMCCFQGKHLQKTGSIIDLDLHELFMGNNKH